MSLRRSLRPLALAACVTLAAGLAGAPADAVEAPPGSKNFTPPGYVPNYFSNESGSFRGGASVGAAQPGAGPAVEASAPRRRVAAASRRHPRHHAGRAATAHGRLRLARGRASAHRHVLYAHAARSGKASRASVAHARAMPAKTKAVAAKSRPAPAKAKRLARARG